MANLNGISVTRVKDTIFIPLPQEDWRRIDGGCACEYCSADGHASKGFWDTLAVGAKPHTGHGTDYAWTVHYPALHGGARPKRKVAA